MLVNTVIRSSSATLVLPFLVGFVFVALGDDLSAWVTANYWPSVTGSATFALPFVGAACAAVAAWEGARLRRGGVFGQAPVRSPLAITVPILLPVAAMGLLGMTAALIVSAAAADVGVGLPHLGITLVAAGILFANTLVGYLVGRTMPGVLAAPLALIGAFFFNAYPSSWSTYWLRHVVGGGLDSCCSVDAVIDQRAIVSGAVFAVAVCMAALFLIHRQGGTIAVAAALALTAAGFGTAGYIARDLPPDAVQPRPTSALICDGKQPTVCLWPEVEHRDLVQSESRKAVARLKEAGIRVPTTLTMAAKPEAGATKLGIATNGRPNDVPAGVASGLLPELPACALKGDAYPAAAALGPVAAWLYTTAGGPAQAVEGRFGPQEAALVQKVRGQSRAAQLDWYQSNMQAMKSCRTQPKLALAEGTP
ncbi:hypothetical protein [Streptomyces niveus]|uniref:DUF7224 domain-containing protein n=1 Tax=Streptomyces niveus TaxID=193462 RepID=A0ABZ1ZXP6_STRNV|nr:hypothetical protein [Streptomyces niveus]